MDCEARIPHAEILRSSCDRIQPITVAVRAVKVIGRIQWNEQPSLRMCRILAWNGFLSEQQHEMGRERVKKRRHNATNLAYCLHDRLFDFKFTDATF
jgi:hypothetical protein